MPEEPRAETPSTPAVTVVRALSAAARITAILATLYVFLVSVKLLGTGFEMIGGGFSERLIATTSNPFVGLFIGILATSHVHSSSPTTSTVVGFVAAGMLSIESAVPIIMGATIGTTVTCATVSLGHIRRPEEFRRAFAAASVHDFFNLMSVAILFPLEIATGFLAKSARLLSRFLVGSEGIAFASPVKRVVGPAVNMVARAIERSAGDKAGVIVAIVGAVILFAALYALVRQTKALAMGRAEVILDRVMGRSGAAGIAVGAGLTAVIQSSAVTTSIMVPLAGAGIARLEQVFPIALGANIGTTVTAILASLAGNADGLTIALVHLIFNIAGILLIYPYLPIRRIPLFLARKLADAAVRSKAYVALFVLGLFYALPALLILIDRWM